MRLYEAIYSRFDGPDRSGICSHDASVVWVWPCGLRIVFSAMPP